MKRKRDGYGGPAVRAQLPSATGVAVDGAGNLYIADAGDYHIYKVDVAGTITKFAFEDRPSYLSGVASDGAGNVYITDSRNHRIRKVDSTGTITTLAGSEATGFHRGGFGGDGGPAVQARLDNPRGVAADGAGNVYIADAGNHRIRKVDATGTITTLAGTKRRGFGGDGDPAVQARLDYPYSVAADGAGNVYIADSGNHRIRKVDATGTITTLAGTKRRGFGGDGGPAVQARLDNPLGVAADGAGNVYIADSDNHRIRKVDATGTITTFAGSGATGFHRGRFGGDGGPAVRAQLASPWGVAADGAGNVYIADTGNRFIRKVDATGTITTFAGRGEIRFSGDGSPAVQAQLGYPRGVAADGAGNVYIADSDNHRIRKVDATGTITTFAGSGATGFVGGGFSGDGGPAVQAQLDSPSSVAADGAGNVYIADASNSRIRKVDATGTITAFAGTGMGLMTGWTGGDGGSAVQAQLAYPRSVATDGAGNVYIADSSLNRILKVDSSGAITTFAQFLLFFFKVSKVNFTKVITTFAGGGEEGFSGDGGPAVQARLDCPYSVAADGAGNVYIADTCNDRIRKVDATGMITTLAGGGEEGFSGDGGPAVQTRLDGPYSVAADGAGNVYIADTHNSRIRKVDATGTITTFAGSGATGFVGGGFSGDGGPAVQAQLDSPSGVAADGAGNVYIADTHNRRIRKVDTTGMITTFAGGGEKKGSAGEEQCEAGARETG